MRYVNDVYVGMFMRLYIFIQHMPHIFQDVQQQQTVVPKFWVWLWILIRLVRSATCILFRLSIISILFKVIFFVTLLIDVSLFYYFY